MQCVLEINTDVCETIADAERDLRGKIAIVEIGLRRAWPAAVVGGDASVFELGRAADHARRALFAAGEPAAGNGAAAGDVRSARARRRRFGRQGRDDLRSHHAAFADAAGAFASAARFGKAGSTGLHSHRSQGDGRPAHRRPADADAQLERIRVAGEPHDRHGVHQHDSRDLVGCAAASQLWHGGSPRVRHAGQS